MTPGVSESSWFCVFKSILRQLRKSHGSAIPYGVGAMGAGLSRAEEQHIVSQLEKQHIVTAEKTGFLRGDGVIALASIVFEEKCLHAKLMDEYGAMLFDYYSDADINETAFWIRHVLAEFRKERIVPFALVVVLPNTFFIPRLLTEQQKGLPAIAGKVWYHLDVDSRHSCIGEAVGVPTVLLPRVYAEYWSAQEASAIKDALNAKSTGMQQSPPDNSKERIVHDSVFNCQGTLYYSGAPELVEHSVFARLHPSSSDTSYDALSALQHGLLRVCLIELFDAASVLFSDIAQAFYAVHRKR